MRTGELLLSGGGGGGMRWPGALAVVPAVGRRYVSGALFFDQTTAKQKIILEADGLMRDISVFDIFEGGNVEGSKKAVAVQFFLPSLDKTLDESDIKLIIDKILQNAKKDCAPSLRG